MIETSSEVKEAIEDEIIWLLEQYYGVQALEEEFCILEYSN
mgnify:CR=1 FL=1